MDANDATLEILLLMEENKLLDATRVARQEFPMAASNIKTATIFCFSVYEKFFNKKHDSEKNFNLK